MAVGSVLNDRYRLESRLSDPDPVQGCLWLGKDLLAGEIPVVIRQLLSEDTTSRFQRHWPLLQSLLHPQLPRLVNCWRPGERSGRSGIGRTAAVSIRSFNSAMSVSWCSVPARCCWSCARSCLLAVLHGRGVVPAMSTPAICCAGTVMACLCCWTSVWSRAMGTLLCLVPPRVSPTRSGASGRVLWMDLHGLGVTALVLLTGQAPESLIAADAVDGPGPRVLNSTTTSARLWSGC